MKLKITHIALNSRVTDGLTYQDNLLPKFHQKLGYEVSMITSKYIWDNNGKIIKDDRDQYKNEYGIKTIRLNNIFGTDNNSKLKKYSNLYNTLKEEKPDILFIHGVQFLDMIEVVKYIRYAKKIEVYVDNHADFSNSATNWLSRNILHRKFWKKMAKIIEPYVTKFYGVLPARVDFLIDMYDIPRNKIELLVMGADDDKVNFANNPLIKNQLRKKHNVQQDDFLIVTGGKIDNAKKQTLSLMKAIKKISNKNIKLIVFGSVIPELKQEVETLADGDRIQYVGWIKSDESYDYFASADLAVFPGRHSVFWEQVIGQGTPMIVKWWEGTTHIDIGGNVKFLYKDSVEELSELLTKIINDRNLYNNMCQSAKKGSNQFLYSNVAKKSLQLHIDN